MITQYLIDRGVDGRHLALTVSIVQSSFHLLRGDPQRARPVAVDFDVHLRAVDLQVRS